MPATEQHEERMFWVLTWKRTVEYLACQRAPAGDGWIPMRHGLLSCGVPYKEGIHVFEAEYDAQMALVNLLNEEKTKLEAWINTVRERALDIGPAGVIVGITITDGGSTTYTITGGPGQPRRTVTAEELEQENQNRQK